MLLPYSTRLASIAVWLRDRDRVIVIAWSRDRVIVWVRALCRDMHRIIPRRIRKKPPEDVTFRATKKRIAFQNYHASCLSWTFLPSRNCHRTRGKSCNDCEILILKAQKISSFLFFIFLFSRSSRSLFLNELSLPASSLLLLLSVSSSL